ncbi:hypothetical protein AAHA92_14483 [Salvia divinorum]|uniref:Uncharacterized protein n=1 Tax=Salvia divinorum TaxID=28513 RepID=A0ABD1HBQ0_SALDI
MDKTTNFPQEGKRPPPPGEEEEEPHSLRESKIQDKRRSSSEPSEFFEFFHDFNSEMSNAEDIISCGKLMLYQNPPRVHPQILKSLSADDATRFSRRHRGGGSLSAAARSRSAARSVESRRLATKPEAADIHRNSSKSSAKSEGSKAAALKPRWFVMMFGPLKLQPEMDLRDIKSRQVRRNRGRLFPRIDGGGGATGGRSDWRSFWGVDLLKVLSCKNHASVAVTASIGLVPHF